MIKRKIISSKKSRTFDEARKRNNIKKNSIKI